MYDQIIQDKYRKHAVYECEMKKDKVNKTRVIHDEYCVETRVIHDEYCVETNKTRVIHDEYCVETNKTRVIHDD
jgi:hypothetical protein